MRLSDAIALGRTLLKPKPGSLGNGKFGCALGMGLISKGIVAVSNRCVDEPVQNWPWLCEDLQLPCSCPIRSNYYNGAQAISHLFDEHVFGTRHWTLDQLIDWVRSVEPTEVEPAVAEGRHTSELVEKQP